MYELQYSAWNLSNFWLNAATDQETKLLFDDKKIEL